MGSYILFSQDGKEMVNGIGRYDQVELIFNYINLQWTCSTSGAPGNRSGIIVISV